MIKNKKGFTLVEIIVCISLLAIIAVIVIVFNVNKDEYKEKKKIISGIVAAADVYGSMNNEIIEKAKSNYGYYVLTIDELKEMGLLDVNQIIPTLSEEEINSSRNVSYDKIIINTNYMDKLGFIDYIYPYFDNYPEILNLNEELDILNIEKNLLRCNTLLNGESENDGKVLYLDKEYKKVVTDDFECGIDETNLEKSTNIIGDDLNVGRNVIKYKIGNDIYGNRIINIKDFKPKIVATTTKGNYFCNGDSGDKNWTNQDVYLTLTDKEGNEITDDSVSSEINGGNAETDVKHKFKVTTSADYIISYKYQGKLNGEVYSGSKSCNVQIDKNAPTIEIMINNNKRIITISDIESGVRGYYISNNDLENVDSITDWKNYLGPFEETFNAFEDSKYIYAVDNAGNIKKDIIESDTVFPSIMYEPIPNSFSKFKVTIKNINSSSDYDLDLNSIRVQYSLNIDDYEPSSEATDPNKKDFKNNFKYNSNFENNEVPNPVPVNYINYDNSKEEGCNEDECSFIIDMEEFINYCAKTENDFCPKIVDFSDLYNLSIDYYIYVKNNKDNYKRLNLNSSLNIFIDNKAYYYDGENKMTWDEIGGARGKSEVIGTNENSDILFTYCKAVDQNIYDYLYVCDIYYHENSSSQNYLVGSYDNENSNDIGGWHNKDSYFTKFTNENIKYYVCSYGKQTTGKGHYWREYEFYEYNILNVRETLLDEDSDSSKRTTYDCDFIDTSSVGFNHPNKIAYKSLSNYTFLNRFLNRYRNWYNNRYDSNKGDYYNTDNLLGDYVYNRIINGINYNFILINSEDKYDNIYRKNLYFIPEVTLTPKKIESGSSK